MCSNEVKISADEKLIHLSQFHVGAYSFNGFKYPVDADFSNYNYGGARFHLEKSPDMAGCTLCIRISSDSTDNH